MKKGKSFETDYFIREDATTKHKLSHDREIQHKKQQNEELRKLHYMKCPKCGHNLETKRMSYIDIDQCSSCGVLVLAPDDVDKFIAEERSILKTLIDFFK